MKVETSNEQIINILLPYDNFQIESVLYGWTKVPEEVKKAVTEWCEQDNEDPGDNEWEHTLIGYIINDLRTERTEMENERPMFVMSMYVNMEELLKAKCKWLEEENERLEGLLLEAREPLLELDENGYEVEVK